MERPKTTLYIVRHAETELNAKGMWQGQTDSPLTEKGLSQAKILADDFRDIQFDAVFSSDTLRAQRTAKIIAMEKELEIKTSELLRERRLGILEGRHKDELREEFKELFEKFESLVGKEKAAFTFDGSVESNDELVSRFITHLRETSLAYPGGSVLIVSHGGVIRNFLGHLDPKYYNFKVKNTAYVKVLCDGVDFEIFETKGIEGEATGI